LTNDIHGQRMAEPGAAQNYEATRRPQEHGPDVNGQAGHPTLEETYRVPIQVLRDQLTAGAAIDDALATLKQATGVEAFGAVATVLGLLRISLEDARWLVEDSDAFGSPRDSRGGPVWTSADYERRRDGFSERVTQAVERVRQSGQQDPDYLWNDLGDRDHREG
jgi:hypothetical protein